MNARTLWHNTSAFVRSHQQTKAFNWIITLLITLFGGILRFVRLGEPRALVFDETYYVKDAWTMLMTGEARDWPQTVDANGIIMHTDEAFAAGSTDNWYTSAEYVVHPPLGKWLISIGLQLFGGAGNPAAWRASTAIAGTIGILLLIRVALRLFNNMSIAALAGILMSVDGLGIVMSSTGILDIFIMVFVLGAFDLLLMHRSWARQRLFEQAAEDSLSVHMKRTPLRVPRRSRSHRMLLFVSRGPQVVFSWYRVGATILLGCATGVKWSGIYFFAVFAVLSVCWDVWDRIQAGYATNFVTSALADGVLAALYMVPLYIATYFLCWLNWFIHPDSYMHNWAAEHPGEGITWLPRGLRSFVQYHEQMWEFHTTLDSPHAYKANPLTWPLQVRPTSFYWEKLSDHPGMCSLSPNTQCVAAVTSLGNPLIWWLGSLCVIIGIVLAIRRHGDWRIWAVLAGFIGGWLPWAMYLNRTTFTFYAIVILPWIILAICYVFDALRQRVSKRTWHLAWGLTVGICVLVAAFFYPIWTAMPVPYDFWLAHMWFHSWI